MKTQDMLFMQGGSQSMHRGRLSLSLVMACMMFSVVMACITQAAAQRSTPIQLIAPDGAASDNFGWTSDYSGDTIVVGAYQDDGPGGADQGSASVYRWTGTGWAHEALLLASDGVAGDRFGYSVAISGDTIAVGADYDDSGAQVNQGAVYVFTRIGTSWMQQAKIMAADGAGDDRFGTSVALQGNTLAVGAYGDDVSGRINQGSVYVYSRSGSTWMQQTKLTASDGLAEDFFGGTLAIDGDTLAVGSFYDTVSGMYHRGSVYVFTRTTELWTQQAQLVASDGEADDVFGHFVSVDGDTIAAGSLGNNGVRGAAYVFTRAGGVWAQEAKITAPDAQPVDGLGSSGCLSGDTLVVTSRHADVGGVTDAGAGYVFVRSNGTWTLQAKLTAPDGAAVDNFGWTSAIVGDSVVIGARNDDVGANVNQGSAWVFSRVGSKWVGPDLSFVASDGAATDSFGYAVDIFGDTAIVGAIRDDNLKGSAYIFTRLGSVWVQQAKLTASDGAAGDYFGVSVAISGDTAIAGAYGDDSYKGAAYVFTRSGTIWTQQAKLTASDGVASDSFGVSVALFDDAVIVGARGDDGYKGSAYVFTRSGTAWAQQAKLTASDGATSDDFGFSVAFSCDTALVGARGDDGSKGSAYVFTRLGTVWSQQAKLNASDGATNDDFGYTVAISGDTAIVGAYRDDVVFGDQGSAYVFTRSGTVWAQQAKLTASDGAVEDRLGISVAISGDTAIVGAYSDDVHTSYNQGSAYIFLRSGTTWTQQTQIIAATGASEDLFGFDVAISDDTVIVGALYHNVGANGDQGSAYTFDLSYDSFSLAHNDSLGTTYPSLAAALLSAQSGQQLTATAAAWSSIGLLDTFGRSLGLFGHSDIRTPSSSILTLGGSSVLGVPQGSVININGQFMTASGGSAFVQGDSFALGSRGILTARTNSSLSINAMTADLDGQTRLEQGATLSFAGAASAIGPTTCGFNSSLTAGSIFTNFDTFAMTAGTINAPLFYNRAQANIFGSSASFGSYANEVGAVTTIRSGTFFVFGSLINNGTIIGTICSNCIGTPPNLDIGGSMTLGSAANLIMPFIESTVRVGGNFDCAIDSHARFDMAQATLQMEGTGQEQTLEIMSIDLGVDPSGLDRSFAGHYPIGMLKIGPSPSTVRLVDNHDNDGLGQGTSEVLYIDQLVIESGSRLDNTQGIIYFNTLINNGTIDVPENVVPLIPPCPADFNQDGGIDGADVEAFMTAWEAGDASSDVNFDGGIDGGDVEAFFIVWEAGGC